MAGQVPPFTRTNYSDPSQQGAVQVGEALVDFSEYSKPLEQIHGANLHGWGIASGLTVTAVIGQANVQVSPGVALDSSGQHIYLAVGGYVQTGPPPTPNATPNTQATLLPQPFIAPTPTNPNPSNLGTAGVTLKTASMSSGPMYLTIRFCETPDDTQTGAGIAQMDHTPWLQFVATAPTDGTSLVLAEVALDGSGNVTNLVAGSRQGPSVPVQRLSFYDYGVESTAGSSQSVATGTESVSIDMVAGKAHVTGDIVVDGTVNGRDISADGTMLDQHDAAIKQLKLEISDLRDQIAILNSSAVLRTGGVVHGSLVVEYLTIKNVNLTVDFTNGIQIFNSNNEEVFYVPGSGLATGFRFIQLAINGSTAERILFRIYNNTPDILYFNGTGQVSSVKFQ